MNLQRTAAYISNVRRRRWRNGRFSAAGQYLGVEEHNGHISAKSVVNEGTTFTISLPVPELVLN